MMNHEREPFHIDPASRNIGGDQDARALLLKHTHHLIALGLHQIAMQYHIRKAKRLQRFAKSNRIGARPAEDQPPLFAAIFQEFNNALQLFALGASDVLMLNIRIHDILFIDL